MPIRVRWSSPMCISARDSYLSNLRTLPAGKAAGWADYEPNLLAIRQPCAGLSLGIVLHQNFIRRQSGDRSEFAFGNAGAERIDCPVITIARRLPRQLALEVLADDIGRRSHDFVVLLGG